MFTNILLPVDGASTSLRAARHGIQLAKILSGKVTVLTVTTPWAAYFARELAVVIPEVVIPKSEYDYKRETTAACILQNVVAGCDEPYFPAVFRLRYDNSLPPEGSAATGSATWDHHQPQECALWSCALPGRTVSPRQSTPAHASLKRRWNQGP